MTTDDIGLRAGDVLVTDASRRAIRSGQTDAKLLRKLHGVGVVIYSREGLHSKVALFGKHAIVGSANMSGSDLIEASVITDSPVIVSGVAAFIEKLSTARTRLSPRDIEKLCAIEVVRMGRFTGRRRTSNPVRRLGNTTWILGVKEVTGEPTERQQKRIDRNRPIVTRRVRVLLKDPEPDRNRFYTQDSTGGSNEVSWSRFQRILKEAGFPRDVKPMSALKLDPAMAEIIDRKWTQVR